MAPVRPRNRQPHRSSNTLLTSHTPSSSPTITGQVNPHTHAPAKILKRRHKHSELLSRLRATHPSKGSGIKKRRRAGRKIPLTSLAALGDALPDADDDVEGEWEGFGDDGDRGGDGMRGRRRRMKSMKTARGSMKKREKAMVAERERFARNLGVLVGGQRAGEREGITDSGQRGGSSERWKAIRRFIQGNGEGTEV